MALLFEDISFRLPLPYEKLTLLLAGEGNPLSCRINAYRINFAIRYLETVNAFKSVDIEYTKDTIVLTNDHNSSLLARLEYGRTEFT